MLYIEKASRTFTILLFALLFGLTGCDQEQAEQAAVPTKTIPKRKPQPAPQLDLPPWLEADIDWRQAEGATPSILAAAHSIILQISASSSGI